MSSDNVISPLRTLAINFFEMQDVYHQKKLDDIMTGNLVDSEKEYKEMQKCEDKLRYVVNWPASELNYGLKNDIEDFLIKHNVFFTYRLKAYEIDDEFLSVGKSVFKSWKDAQNKVRKSLSIQKFKLTLKEIDAIYIN
jgi:hypothetical protein